MDEKMLTLTKKITPVLIVLLTLFWVDTSFFLDTADARSKRGGRSFSSAPKRPPAKNVAPAQQQKKSGSFAKGLAGGLLGGAIGSMLFGSMFGGEGMGILPILILAGLGFFLFRKFAAQSKGNTQTSGFSPTGGGVFNQGADTNPPSPSNDLENGLNEIRMTDKGFDPAGFLEIASDAFFQIQAGWTRRSLDSYGNLLGSQLAAEYEGHFTRMREKKVINKLESIAIRKVEITAAGTTGTEDFVTVLFLASLLDYTIDETTGELVEGSMTQPVKFEENWTWARPKNTHDWRLEGIEVVNE